MNFRLEWSSARAFQSQAVIDRQRQQEQAERQAEQNKQRQQEQAERQRIQQQEQAARQAEQERKRAQQECTSSIFSRIGCAAKGKNVITGE
jgi:colicin import membrane protein